MLAYTIRHGCSSTTNTSDSRIAWPDGLSESGFSYTDRIQIADILTIHRDEKVVDLKRVIFELTDAIDRRKHDIERERGDKQKLESYALSLFKIDNDVACINQKN